MLSSPYGFFAETSALTNLSEKFQAALVVSEKLITCKQMALYLFFLTFSLKIPSSSHISNQVMQLFYKLQEQLFYTVLLPLLEIHFH
jgi:hypothetical protein